MSNVVHLQVKPMRLSQTINRTRFAPIAYGMIRLIRQLDIEGVDREWVEEVLEYTIAHARYQASKQGDSRNSTYALPPPAFDRNIHRTAVFFIHYPETLLAAGWAAALDDAFGTFVNYWQSPGEHLAGIDRAMNIARQASRVFEKELSQLRPTPAEGQEADEVAVLPHELLLVYLTDELLRLGLTISKAMLAGWSIDYDSYDNATNGYTVAVVLKAPLSEGDRKVV